MSGTGKVAAWRRAPGGTGGRDAISFVLLLAVSRVSGDPRSVRLAKRPAAATCFASVVFSARLGPLLYGTDPPPVWPARPPSLRDVRGRWSQCYPPRFRCSPPIHLRTTAPAGPRSFTYGEAGRCGWSHRAVRGSGDGRAGGGRGAPAAWLRAGRPAPAGRLAPISIQNQPWNILSMFGSWNILSTGL